MTQFNAINGLWGGKEYGIRIRQKVKVGRDNDRKKEELFFLLFLFNSFSILMRRFKSSRQVVLVGGGFISTCDRRHGRRSGFGKSQLAVLPFSAGGDCVLHCYVLAEFQSRGLQFLHWLTCLSATSDRFACYLPIMHVTFSCYIEVIRLLCVSLSLRICLSCII